MLSEGKTIKKSPINAKGVFFEEAGKQVTGVGNKDSFVTSRVVERRPSNPVNVPFRKGFAFGNEFELSSPKQGVFQKSVFEQGTTKNPQIVSSEGSIFSESVSKRLRGSKEFSVPKTTTFKALKTIEYRLPSEKNGLQIGDAFQKYNQEVVIKDRVLAESVLSKKGSRTSAVSRKFSDSFALSSPSRTYAKAYEKLYGKELFPSPKVKSPSTPRTVKGYDRVIDFPDFLQKQAEIKIKNRINANQRSALKQRFTDLRLKNDFVSKTSSKTSFSEQGLGLVSKGSSEKVFSPSSVEVGFFDFGNASKYKPFFPSTSYFGFSGVPSTVNKPRSSLFAGVSRKNVSTPSLFSNISSGSVLSIKPKSSTSQISLPKSGFSNVQLPSTRLFSSLKTTEKNTVPVIPAFDFSPSPFTPRGGFGGFLGGGGGSSGFGGRKARRSAKTKYQPSLGGLVFHVKKSKASLRSEAFGFGVRGY